MTFTKIMPMAMINNGRILDCFSNLYHACEYRGCMHALHSQNAPSAAYLPSADWRVTADGRLPLFNSSRDVASDGVTDSCTFLLGRLSAFRPALSSISGSLLIGDSSLRGVLAMFMHRLNVGNSTGHSKLFIIL